MEQTTIDNIIRWLTLLTMIVALVGTFAILGTAAIQSLRNRVVRWDMLAYVLVILWSLPYGIRNYGPELADASIDLLVSLAEKRPAMESAIRSFLGNDLAIDGGGDVTIPTAVFTSTPMPTVDNHFNATATAFFEEFPTALPANTPEPTETPRPMIEPTRTLVPSPTVCVARETGDLQRGCVPPTLVPGG